MGESRDQGICVRIYYCTYAYYSILYGCRTYIHLPTYANVNSNVNIYLINDIYFSDYL